MLIHHYGYSNQKLERKCTCHFLLPLPCIPHSRPHWEELRRGEEVWVKEARRHVSLMKSSPGLISTCRGNVWSHCTRWCSLSQPFLFINFPPLSLHTIWRNVIFYAPLDCVQRDIQGLEITVPLDKWCNYTETAKSGLGFHVASNLEIDKKKEITAECSEAAHV